MTRPVKIDASMKPGGFRLTSDQSDRIDAICDRTAFSRSNVVRSAMEWGLNRVEKETATAEQAIAWAKKMQRDGIFI